MNITGNKVLYNLENVAQGKPITADVFLNDYCNNRCPYCTYARYGERNGEYMSFELFQEVVEKLLSAGVKGIILTGGGEPTISKDFDKITAWLEAEGTPYGINTNFNVYKEIRPAYLKVSLDAYDRESYIRKRGVDAYDRTLSNLQRYLDWREKTGGKTIVGVQLVVENVREAAAFWEANKDLPVDYFNFRPVESTGGQYYKGKKPAAIRNFISALRDEDPRVTLNYKWDYLWSHFDKCYGHCLQVAVNQRGELMYCCHKPYEVIGSIKEPDIWERYAAAKTDMTMCDVPCRLTGPNEFMEEIEKGCQNPEFI